MHKLLNTYYNKYKITRYIIRTINMNIIKYNVYMMEI